MHSFDDDWTDAGDAGPGCGIWGVVIFGLVGVSYFVLRAFGIDIFEILG